MNETRGDRVGATGGAVLTGAPLVSIEAGSTGLLDRELAVVGEVQPAGFFVEVIISNRDASDLIGVLQPVAKSGDSTRGDIIAGVSTGEFASTQTKSRDDHAIAGL